MPFVGSIDKVYDICLHLLGNLDGSLLIFSRSSDVTNMKKNIGNFDKSNDNHYTTQDNDTYED